MVQYDAPFLDKDNNQPRCACVLVLDHSASMQGKPITKLNEALRGLPTELASDPLISKRVEIAVVGFPPTRIVQPFCSVAEFVPPTLAPVGTTPLGGAVQLSLRLIEERKAVYRTRRLDYFRPLLVIITDGAPDQDDDWRGAAASVADAEEREKVTAFAIGVPGADMAVLQEFSRRPAAMLIDLKFRELFTWLCSTLKAVSGSQSHSGADPNAKVPLAEPPPRTFSWDAA